MRLDVQQANPVVPTGDGEGFPARHELHHRRFVPGLDGVELLFPIDGTLIESAAEKLWRTSKLDDE